MLANNLINNLTNNHYNNSDGDINFREVLDWTS